MSTTSLEQPAVATAPSTGMRVREAVTSENARVQAVESPVAPRRWTRPLVWATQFVTASILVMASWSELGHNPHAAIFAELERLGSSRHNLVLAVFGIFAACAVLDIDTAGVAAMLLSVVGLSAVVGLGLTGQIALVPLVALVATATITWHRRSELSEYARYLRRKPCERLHILCPEDDLLAGRRKPLRDNEALLC